ncbi:MAG: aminotransferase class IV [Clostridiales bacterium]|nr:aminotransferase class IV [Clostridiales bacterium]
METLGYYNGKFDEIEKMTIPMTDRVCWFGDGIYDATYAHNHKIFDTEAHVNRFFNSAKLLDIVMPIEKEELISLLNDLVKKVDSPDQFVYMQVTRGSGLRGHNYSKGDQNKANLWVTLTPSKVADTYKPVSVITYEDKRFLYCNVKTLNLIPSCLAATAADKAGCHEAIFHRGDIVTECAHSNVSIFKDGKVISHPLNNEILPGTARIRLLRFAEKLGFGVEEREYTLDELMNADEVVIHSTGSFCIPVSTVDGKPVGGKAPEMLKTIQDALVADFEEQCKAD